MRWSPYPATADDISDASHLRTDAPGPVIQPRRVDAVDLPRDIHVQHYRLRLVVIPGTRHRYDPALLADAQLLVK